MHHNQLIIDLAREIYLKQKGRDHRQIEMEMRRRGCLTFTRRVLHSQKTRTGRRPGWIELYGWRELLSEPPAVAGGLTEPEGKFKQGGRAETQVLASVFYYPQTEAEQRSTGMQGIKEIEKESPSSPSSLLNSSPTDFQAFLKQTAGTMTWHWPYQKLIFEQLERITSGESKRLMIFLPPRHGKSELVTNRYAAWRLKQDPKMNIIIGSYNQRLANRFSRKVRITWEDSLSEPPAVAGGLTRRENKLKQDRQDNQDIKGNPDHPVHPVDSSSAFPASSSFQRTPRARLNTVSEWETGLGGGVRAVGVGGGITGFGADLVIIDDPIKSRAEAESKTYRERVWEWFNDDLYTRLEPNAAIILIQTRWHEDDLAGRLLREAQEEGGEHWDVISLPALAERSEDTPVLNAVASTAYKQDSSPRSEAHEDKSVLAPLFDPLGREPGEALCPDRFTKEDLERIKRKLGSYSFSALYQQRPTPPEGGLFKRSWFTRIANRPPDNLRWARGYDLAVSTKESADFTASFRCALDKQTGDLYIADGFRKRIEFPEQKRFVTEKIRTERNTEHGIEQALHAQAFVQELRRQPGLITRPIRLVRPAADKFTRALSWANLAEEGKVVLVRGTTSTNPAFRQPNWIDAFLEEICNFPNSTHDDQLDAVSIAVQMLERQKNAFHAF
jgi:predicted phage terminase large subunit-like protein